MQNRSSTKRVRGKREPASDKTVRHDTEPTFEVESLENSGKNPAAVYLGRLGGLKGGKARAMKLSAERKSEIASLAARTRWRNNPRGK